ncbi:MAG: ATP-binding protein [Actinomycetota bacterium]
MSTGSSLLSPAGRLGDVARWGAIVIGFVLAGSAIADGSAGAIGAAAIAVAYGVYTAMRQREVELIEDLGFLLAINAAAVVGDVWAAFVPLIVVALALAGFRDFTQRGGDRSDPAGPVGDPFASPDPVVDRVATVESSGTIDDLPRLIAANERRRAVRAADRATEWLTFTQISLESLRSDNQRIIDLREDVEAAVEEMRLRVDLVLEADAASDLTFAERLRGLAAGACDLHGWDAQTEITSEDEASSPAAPLIRQALLDIAAEALDNAGRHADADTVTVRWEARGSARQLSVVDDGAGFDVDADRGLGVVAMERTARAIGAQFELVSVADRGTAVAVTLST